MMNLQQMMLLLSTLGGPPTALAVAYTLGLRERQLVAFMAALALFLATILAIPSLGRAQLTYEVGYVGISLENPTGAYVWDATNNSRRPVSDVGLVLAYDMQTITSEEQLLDLSKFGNYGTFITGGSQTITLQPSDEDTYISESLPDSNFGTDPNLVIDADSCCNTRALVRFNISGIPQGVTILSAKLGLYLHTTTFDDDFPRTYLMQRVTQSWSEGNATWNNQPPTVTTNQASLTIQNDTTFVGYYDWNITEMFREWYDGSSPNYGILLRDQDETSGFAHSRFYSRDTTTANKPRLVLKLGAATDRFPLVQGAYGGARDFNGVNQYVNTGLDIPPDEFTLVAVVKADSLTSADNAKAILTNRDLSVRSEWQYYVKDTRKITFTGFDTASPQQITVSITSSVAIQLGQTSIVGLTWDGFTACHWVDGQAAGCGSRTRRPIADVSIPVTIGEMIQDPDRYWDGPIDEVLIFTEAKSDLDMQWLTTPKTTVTIGPVGEGGPIGDTTWQGFIAWAAVAMAFLWIGLILWTALGGLIREFRR